MKAIAGWRSSRSVIVYAYTRLNLGDDLLIKTLAERYPEFRFVLRVPNDDRRGTFIHGLSKVKNIREWRRVPGADGLLKMLGSSFRLDDFRWSRLQRRSIAVVRIGGSIFSQQDDWQDKIELDRRRLGTTTPTYVLGCNFGPYSDERFLKGYRDIFSRVRDVCFRDQASYDLFSTLDVARLAPDLVLASDEIRSKPSFEQEKGEVLGISVIDLSWRVGLEDAQESYETTIVKVAELALAEGWQVRFIGFCDHENDGDVIRRLIERMGGPTAALGGHVYRGDLPATLAQVANCTHWLATRFHAAILGWMYGSRVVPVSYGSKTQEFLEYLEYKGPQYTVADLCPDLAVEVFAAISSDGALLGSDALREAQFAAQGQFAELDHLLHRGEKSRVVAVGDSLATCNGRNSA